MQRTADRPVLPSRPQENVQGPRCDQCRLGTFSLDAANPKGCTRCFCFGATERCRGSAHARREVCGQRDPDRAWLHVREGTRSPSRCPLGVQLDAPPVCPQHVDMEGWTLLSGDRQVVPHELRAEAELLYADLRRGFEAFPELYWQAPPSYLGDRVSGRARPWRRHCEGGGETAARLPMSREGWGRCEGAQA